MTSEEQALVVKFNLKVDSGNICYTDTKVAAGINEQGSKMNKVLKIASLQGTPKDTLEEPKGNE